MKKNFLEKLIREYLKLMSLEDKCQFSKNLASLKFEFPLELVEDLISNNQISLLIELMLNDVQAYMSQIMSIVSDKERILMIG